MQKQLFKISAQSNSSIFVTTSKPFRKVSTFAGIFASNRLISSTIYNWFSKDQIPSIAPLRKKLIKKLPERTATSEELTIAAVVVTFSSSSASAIIVISYTCLSMHSGIEMPSFSVFNPLSVSCTNRESGSCSLDTDSGSQKSSQISIPRLSMPSIFQLLKKGASELTLYA